MKNKFTKLTAMLLVVCMMFSFSSVAFAADEAGEEPLKYVSIGDSMTNGYGLEGYEEPQDDGTITNWFGFMRNNVEGSYPYKVADHFDWELSQIATSGLRADDVYYLLNLGTDYEVNWDEYGDQYMAEKFEQSYKDAHGGASGSKAEIIAWAAEQYQAEVKDADVISIGIGSNNFATLMDMRMMWWMGRILGDESMFSDGGYQGAFDFNELVADLTAEQKAQIAEMYNEAYAKIEEILTDAAAKVGISLNAPLAADGATLGDLVADMTNAIAYTTAGFAMGYKGTVDTIIRENDDAEIIIVGLTNWFKGMVYGIPVGETMFAFPMGDMMEVVCELAGVYMAALPAAYDAAAKLNETEMQPIYFADTNADEVEAVELIVDVIVNKTADVDLNSLEAYELGSEERFEAAKAIAQKISSDALPHGTTRARLLEAMGQYVMRMMGMRVPTVADVEAYEAYIDGGYTTQKDCYIDVTLGGNRVHRQTYYLEGQSHADTSAYLHDKYGILPETIALEDYVTEEELNAIYGELRSGEDPVAVLAPYIERAIYDAIYNAVYPYYEGCIAYLGLEKSMISSLHLDVVNVEHFQILSSVTNLMNVTMEALDGHMDADPNNIAGALIAVPELGTVSNLMFNFLVGSGVIVHPSDDGHTTIANVIVDAYENKHTATDETVENLIVAANTLADLVAEYYDEAYEYAYDYADENGYIEEANNAIDAAIAAFEAIDHEGIGMSEELAEEIAADITEIIATLEAAKTLLNEADELDAASLDALLALLNEAAELGEELLGTLEQAGADVNEYVIIPALNEAYRILVEEVIPQVDRQLQIAVKAGTDWLMEKAGEAYAAFLAALPEIDAALYNYFYNNPEEVIAFFEEYGDEIGVLFAEYGDELFAVLGFIAYTFGEDALDYVMTHPCETVKFFLDWYAKYGERTWAMIHVYADALGICQCENIDEIVADLVACGTEYVEAVLDALKAHVEEKVAEQIAYIEALIEQIKNAVEDNVEDVIDTVKEQIDAAVAELQAKLAALIENYKAELYDATHVVYDTCPENHVYVSLGGAVAYGDGLGRNDKTYTDLFEAYLDENVETVTKIDRTVADLDINGLTAYIMDNAAAIASADIITYNLDAAGILDALLAGDEFVNNWAAYASAEDVAKADMIIAEINKLLAEKYDVAVIELAEELVETVVYATVAFGVESYKAIETIRAINPEAAVLAVGMYNPFAGMTVTVNGEVLPIGDYFDYAIEATNLYYELYAIASDNFTFVEADEADIAAAIEIVIAEGMDYVTLIRQLMGAEDAMLATAEGHEYIADCIADAIIFEGHNFVYIETIDPTYTAQGYDIYECSKCGKIEYRNFTDVLPLPINPSTPVIPVAPEKYECDGGENCPCRRFTDLDPAQWYHYGVDYMILKGIMIGIGDGLFAPHKAITRAEVAQMLWRLEGCPEATVELNFSDVAADAWYTEAVRWAVESETFLGYGDGTFGPNDIITREQLAAVMYRYAAECDVDVTAEKALADFTDADTVSAWAVDSLEWAYAVEMMIGTGDGKMNPLGDATRATIATVFHRYIENILKLVLEDVK